MLDGFARKCLRVPRRGSRCRKLSKLLNKQINDEENEPAPPVAFLRNRKGSYDSQLVARRVSRKLEEGNIKGAVRLATSADIIAEVNDSTISALQSKHPPPYPESSPIPAPDKSHLNNTIIVSTLDLIKAIKTFPRGSAGGPDGLRPQHLLDLMGSSAGEAGALHIQALTNFANQVLANETPEIVCPFFFRATITTITKKDGGLLL